jgi:hypothetical protein
VTVSGSHTALITISTQCSNGTDGGGCIVSFALSGATSLAASDARAFGLLPGSAGLKGGLDPISGSATYAVTLNSGTTTITAAYKDSALGTATFTTSTIIVQVY